MVDALGQRHLAVADAIRSVEARDTARAEIEAEIAHLSSVAGALAVTREVSPRSLDAVAAIGEILSCRLVAALFADADIPATAVDPRTLIVTDEHFTQAVPQPEPTRAHVDVNLRPVVTSGRVAVTGGFVAATRAGVVTTLGRGGSDYSAAILGAAIDADEIQIWTDVDGMLTADPRVVADCRLVPFLSFAEAAELAYFGAKVLHPKTIQPAAARNIPVRILNTFRPEAPGTLIADNAAVDAASVTALACKRGITVVTITSTGMLMAHGYMRRLFEIFERFRTSVDVVSTSEVSVSVTIDNVAHLDGDRRRPVGVRRGQRRRRPGAGGGGGRPVRHRSVSLHPGRPGARRHPAAAGLAGRRPEERHPRDRRGRFVERDGPTSCRILPAGREVLSGATAGRGFSPGEDTTVGRGFSPADQQS